MARRGKTLKALKKRAALVQETAVESDDAQTKGGSMKRRASNESSPQTHKRTRIVNHSAPNLSIKEAVALQNAQKRIVEAPSTISKTQVNKFGGLTEDEKKQYVGLDCEMVGTGLNGKRSVLARACVVNWHGDILYDAFVKVDERVTDFRTQFSGVRPSDLKSKQATKFSDCVTEVARLLKGKILVGHALVNDLKVLMLSHPRAMIRDTATYRPLMRYAHGKFRPRKLKDLVKEHLQLTIQGGEHTPDEDASAAMKLYQSQRSEWEKNLRIFRGNGQKQSLKIKAKIEVPGKLGAN